MSDERSANESLKDIKDEIILTIPLAKKLGYKHISINITVDIAEELTEILSRLEKLNDENERLTDSLHSLLESGALRTFEDVEKARKGLGLI